MCCHKSGGIVEFPLVNSIKASLGDHGYWALTNLSKLGKEDGSRERITPAINQLLGCESGVPTASLIRWSVGHDVGLPAARRGDIGARWSGNASAAGEDRHSLLLVSAQPVSPVEYIRAIIKFWTCLSRLLVLISARWWGSRRMKMSPFDRLCGRDIIVCKNPL